MLVLGRMLAATCILSKDRQDHHRGIAHPTRARVL